MGATVERRDEVRLDSGETVPYVFKRVPRRRHAHIVVNDEGTIEVRAPWRFSLAKAREMLRENAQWVERTVSRVRERRAQRPRLVTGAHLPLLDGSLCLEVHPRPRTDLFEDDRWDDRQLRPGDVERRGTVLKVSPGSFGEAGLRALIEHWYRREAAAWFAERVAHYAPQLGVQPSRVAIRGQRTRWGSCSTTGTVSLNWRLMMVPGALVDYIVVHELCHLRHMNHSPQFWAMVAGIVPDYRQRRRRLDALQGTLPL